MDQFLPHLRSIIDAPSLKVTFGFISALLLELMGANWMAYEILFILVGIDTITGLMVAWKRKTISSKRFFGVGRKLLIYFLLIIAAHQVVRLHDYLQWAEDGIAMALAFTELLSIIENGSNLGVNIPPWIKEKLQNYIGHDPQIPT